MGDLPFPFGCPSTVSQGAVWDRGAVTQDRDSDGGEPGEGQRLRVFDEETKASTVSSHTAGEASEVGLDENQEREVVGLARIMTEASRRGSTLVAAEDCQTNPFVNPEGDPELNPNDGNFNVRKWLKAILHITARDPERYPKRTAGVFFRNLSVHGFGTAADYQANVANTWLKGFGVIKSLFGFGKKVRIDILRDFEGLVKSGEMLVVLGRPGR